MKKQQEKREKLQSSHFLFFIDTHRDRHKHNNFFFEIENENVEVDVVNACNE